MYAATGLERPTVMKSMIKRVVILLALRCSSFLTLLLEVAGKRRSDDA